MGKHVSNEYKEYVVKLIVDEGRVMREVSYELEIPYSTMADWVSAYKRKLKSRDKGEEYITPSELEKLKKQHNKEMERLKEENEILKKAMHIFTKNQE